MICNFILHPKRPSSGYVTDFYQNAASLLKANFQELSNETNFVPIGAPVQEKTQINRFLAFVVYSYRFDVQFLYENDHFNQAQAELKKEVKGQSKHAAQKKGAT